MEPPSPLLRPSIIAVAVATTIRFPVMPLPHPDHLNLHPSHNRHSRPFLRRISPNSLPDFLLAALSLLFLFSSSSQSSSSRIPPFSCPFFPRRSPKFSSMSISPPNPNKSPRKLKFSTPQSLSDYLWPRLPSDSFSSWGVKPGTKNLHNLWLEISEGETSLEPDSDSSLSIPLRTLHVVSIRILAPEDDHLVLVEFQQEMSDGSVRRRERFLSEKMKPGECHEGAAVRAVREELGEGAVVRLIDGSYRMRVEERESASYPGLPACYVMHVFYARVVKGLPLPVEKEEFWTEEVGESEVKGKAVKVKRHCWKWVPADWGRA